MRIVVDVDVAGVDECHRSGAAEAVSASAYCAMTGGVLHLGVGMIRREVVASVKCRFALTWKSPVSEKSFFRMLVGG